MKKIISSAALAVLALLLLWGTNLETPVKNSGTKEIENDVNYNIEETQSDAEEDTAKQGTDTAETAGKTMWNVYAGMAENIQQDLWLEDVESADVTNADVSGSLFSEEDVYTFLQGPKSWNSGITWSGEWCNKIVKGNSFGGFGCGLCCMANIYSTLTGYEASPLDLYDYATTVTSYYPSKQSGAIGWDDMNTTLQVVGMDSVLCRKPDSYEEFQKQIAESQSAIVLVSSNEDDTFWKDTAGHYVNIWLYNVATDQVFLAEPGDPDNNRSWIPLRYVYDALKTVSDYQYLLVDGYEEADNQWKHNGIDDNWNAPQK